MYMIETEGLRKSFVLARSRKQVEAVRGIDLQVEEGEIFGFLGPNGAGKTTTQRMLTTLVPPDAGRATVVGHDLSREAQRVREHIGAVSQSGGADNSATGRENMVLQARLYGMNGEYARTRAAELVEALNMGDFVDRVVITYSGGQRRHLDLGLGLVHRPRLLFLDEPSLGLDPQSRAQLWDEVRKVRTGGTTIFLTTHYLDEADSLCDRLAIMDEGRIVAEGTPTQLKQQIAGDVITLLLTNHADTQARAQELLSAQAFVRDIKSDDNNLQIYVEHGGEMLAQVLRLLEDAHLNIQSIALAQPSLNDVFLRQTGRSLHAQKDGQSQQAAYTYVKSAGR